MVPPNALDNQRTPQVNNQQPYPQQFQQKTQQGHAMAFMGPQGDPKYQQANSVPLPREQPTESSQQWPQPQQVNRQTTPTESYRGAPPVPQRANPSQPPDGRRAPTDPSRLAQQHFSGPQLGSAMEPTLVDQGVPPVAARRNSMRSSMQPGQSAPTVQQSSVSHHRTQSRLDQSRLNPGEQRYRSSPSSGGDLPSIGRIYAPISSVPRNPAADAFLDRVDTSPRLQRMLSGAQTRTISSAVPPAPMSGWDSQSDKPLPTPGQNAIPQSTRGASRRGHSRAPTMDRNGLMSPTSASQAGSRGYSRNNRTELSQENRYPVFSGGHAPDILQHSVPVMFDNPPRGMALGPPSQLVDPRMMPLPE
jgi:hypothetical protein